MNLIINGLMTTVFGAPGGGTGTPASAAIAVPWESNMKTMIALAVLALALIAGTAAVMKTVQPHHAVACPNPGC